MKLADFINAEGQERIAQAITQAEKHTSGEICVHVTPKCRGDIMKMAEHKFNKLRLYNTLQRNAVLVLIAYESRKFAIIGDQGINKVVPSNFWDSEKNTLLAYLKEGQVVEGLCQIIAQMGNSLKSYFPCQDNDVNEIDNAVTFDEEDDDA